ncbi:MAG TPA: hypothetical protein VNI82_00385 [Candidatus Nitrosotenuis sp.]|nr:hypothetical protein [Candidatus Nitrosotenuis sp.]
MDDFLREALGWLMGQSPAGSFWDLISGSGRDALNDALQIIMNRPSPDFSKDWFMNNYNKTFVVGLMIGALVQLFAGIAASMDGSPLAVIKAFIVDYALLFVVAFSIPAVATIGVRLSDQLTQSIIELFGGEPEVSWFESLLTGGSMINTEAIFYSMLSTALRYEATAITLVTYVVVLLGPAMFAMRNLGEGGARINRTLWKGLLWSLSSFPAMVLVLAMGNTLLGGAPIAAFVAPASGTSVVIILFLLATALTPLFMYWVSSKSTVSVINKVQGKFESNGGGYVAAATTAAAAGSAVGVGINNRRLSAINTTVEQSRGKSAGQITKQIGTQVGMAAARKHPAAAAAITIGTGATKVVQARSQRATPSQSPPSGHPTGTTPVQRPPSGPPTKPIPPPAPPTGTSETGDKR